MYFGPLKWPTRRIWLAAITFTLVMIVLELLSQHRIALVLTGLIVVVVLTIAAPRRASDLGAEELRRSRPDE